jgi:hypothetical protein
MIVHAELALDLGHQVEVDAYDNEQARSPHQVCDNLWKAEHCLNDRWNQSDKRQE